VIDKQGRPIGIVTEQDIIRRVAFKVSAETAVEAVMTSPVMTIQSDDYLYHAIAHMRRRDLRHMPVVDDAGTLQGMLNLHDALAVASARIMGQIDRLTHEGTIEGLKEIKAAQIVLAEELYQDSLPAPEIQALLTHINNDIYRRVIDASLQNMFDEGLGEAPVPFAAIVFGSGGRGENYLFPDQDNGFILCDYPDADHDRIDGFFRELAERMTRDLNAVGMPLCKGNCMATNPLWRKTLSQWIEQITLWGQKRNVVAIRLADIFFDFRPIWGDYQLAATLREKVTGMIAKSHFFLREMYNETEDHNVALGFFGTFQTERELKNHKGEINLKHTGTLPLVEAVRLLALREGVDQTATLGRIDALHSIGALDDNEREELTSAFELITELLLMQQIRDFKAGREVGNYIDPGSLSKRKKTLLTQSLKAIDSLRKRVRSEFTAEIF
ncbi:MAG: DUF294 nucleotidyltransferase-like domain-containing protein, partial [Rhodospirillales bacterium]|nr:DUF294 nucleotidyltransferase-like domain-containing protein [Rhodospirillales bacterium]